GALLAVGACSGSTTSGVAPGDVASVAVSPSTSSVSVGGRVPLSAVVQDASGHALSGADVFWSVQNTSIATISDDGIVTGVAPGTTQVSANVAGKSGVGTVTIARGADPLPQGPVPVASVRISPSNPPAIGKNDNLALTASLTDASGKDIGPGRVVTWTSSDPSIASVTPKAGTYGATVKGNKEGAATITATSEGKSASVAITVKH
ncbi:MAG TPA: Ig-like domain-containing protein, partial [Gemmatimonadaceae bacterium]|nr:Ig-like domain-containing protein [Gemmatimonadaceae bacterium]